MKIKILVLLLAIALVFGVLAGCVEDTDEEPDEPDEPEPTMPTANFTYEPMDITIGMDVNFTDTSTLGDATTLTWAWDFDDGNTSTEQNPMHNYSMAGNYTVTLTVTDETDDTLTDMSEAEIIEVVAE